MLKQAIIIFALFLLGGPAGAQRLKIPELPDDLYEREMAPLLPTSLQTRMKAVEFEYRLSTPYRLQTDFTSDADGYMKMEQRIRFKYRIPIVLKDKINLIIGHSFNRNTFVLEDDFDQTLVGQISKLELKGNRFTLFANYDVKENQSVLGALSLSLNGGYDEFANFAKEYRIYRVIAAYRFVQDVNNDWGVGFYFKKGFRSTSFLPFVTWNKTFNDKWGFEFSVIKFNMRHNLNDDNILLFGYEYLSEDYAVVTDFLPEDEQHVYEFKWPKINLTGKWHHRFLPVLWLETEAGFQYNWQPSTELEGANAPEDNIQVNSHGLIFHFSLYLSPPDKWLQN